MKLERCDREDATLEAARLDAWTDELRGHAAGCSVCSEVALIALYLNDDLAGAPADHPLPDAGRIWWRGQLLARRAAAEKAARPISYMERGAAALGIGTLAAGVAWGWPILDGWIGSLASGSASPAAQAAHAASSSGLGFAALAGIFLLPVLLAISVLNTVRGGR